jgi:hypothetical protein
MGFLEGRSKHENNCSYPLSVQRREGRPAKRSRGESTIRHALAVMSTGLTHPAIALLGIPLFAARKEGKIFRTSIV